MSFLSWILGSSPSLPDIYDGVINWPIEEARWDSSANHIPDADETQMRGAYDRGEISAEVYHEWIVDAIHTTCQETSAFLDQHGTLLADDNGYWDADGYYHASQY